jgi:hypothetical protein
VLFFHISDAEPTWEPLERLRDLVGHQPGVEPPDVERYMYMGAVVDDERTITIHLYKHHLTRRYLNVDDAGHAYVYAGSADDEFVTAFYDPLPDLVGAIEWAQGEAEWMAALRTGDDAA